MRTKIAGVLYVLKTILRSLFYKQKSLGRIDQGFFVYLNYCKQVVAKHFLIQSFVHDRAQQKK